MAKRHHESERSRYREHAGEERRLHGYHRGDVPRYEGHYEGMENRRKEEMRDAGMIQEDKSAIANLPQDVMIKEYPRTGPYNPEMIDDTIRSVDSQMSRDDSQRAKSFRPHKY